LRFWLWLLALRFAQGQALRIDSQLRFQKTAAVRKITEKSKGEKIMFQQKNFKIHFFLFITLWLLCALMMQPVAFATEGKLVYDTIHSPALEGNLVGDSADRSVIVYLPPSYDTSPEKRYPVVYILHGAMCGHYLWVGGGICAGLYGDFNIKTVMDRLITVQPTHI
jgi:hypothetical protein